jgi:cytochrome c5
VRSPRTIARRRFACLLVPAVALVACSSGPDGSAAPKALPPLSPSLQKTYDTTCKTCHEDAASGAPRAGDAKAWAPVLAQAKSVVIDHVVNGYRKMPPMGMCMHCTEADFVALTEHMAGAGLR